MAYMSHGQKFIVNLILINPIIKNYETTISNLVVENSMIGSKSKINGLAKDLSVGDYTELDA